MEYSSHEKGVSSCPSRTVEPSRAVASSGLCSGSYSSATEGLRANVFLIRSIVAVYRLRCTSMF